MTLQLGEVDEGIGTAEFGGVDQTHEHVADPCTVLGQIKQAVLPMKNGLLQTSLADVVIEWGAGPTQEQGEPVPVVEQVGDSLAQTGVRFDLLFFQLSREPLVQLVHYRRAVLLVKSQTLLG